MTKTEAIQILLARFEIRAKIVSSEPDPAGTTYECEPDPQDLAVAEALVGRKLTEADLWFSSGTGFHASHYRLPGRLLQEVKDEHPRCD